MLFTPPLINFSTTTLKLCSFQSIWLYQLGPALEAPGHEQPALATILSIFVDIVSCLVRR